MFPPRKVLFACLQNIWSGFVAQVGVTDDDLNLRGFVRKKVFEMSSSLN